MKQAFSTLRPSENSEATPSVSAPLEGIQRVYEKKGIFLNGFNPDDAAWAIDSDVGISGGDRTGRDEIDDFDDVDDDEDDDSLEWGVSDVVGEEDDEDDRPRNQSSRSVTAMITI